MAKQPTLKAEFRELLKNKPVPPYATLPVSGIDVEWSELYKAWKVDMGMDVNEFLKRNPDIRSNLMTRFVGNKQLHKQLKNYNVSARSLLSTKRGLTDAILSELITATDLADEAPRAFIGQQLRSIRTGTLTAEARGDLYQGALRRGSLPGDPRNYREVKNGILRESPPSPTRKPSRQGFLYKGIVPPDVADAMFDDIYAPAREAELDLAASQGRNPYTKGAGFEYEGTSFGWQQAGKSSRHTLRGLPYQLYLADDKKFTEALRRSNKLGLTPYMSPAEWLEIRDIYRYAKNNGLDVDHIQPLSAGGLHHPRNLQLLSRADNRAKGSQLIDDFSNRAVDWKSDVNVERSQADINWANKKSQWSWDHSLEQYDKKRLPSFDTLQHIDGFSKYGRTADSAITFGAGLATGDPGAVIGGGTGIALGNPSVAKFLAKRLARTSGKLAPGLGAVLSTADAGGYALQGRWLQSGIATVGGIAGETGILEPVSVAADLLNTGIDLATGNFGNPDMDTNTTKHIDADLTDWKRLGRVGRFLN